MQPHRNPIAALEFEIAEERASALGRLGRGLEGALAALRSFDAEAKLEANERQVRRDRLVAQAGEALWYLVVQRDACGLHFGNRVIADYGVPREVANRMGPAAVDETEDQIGSRPR